MSKNENEFLPNEKDNTKSVSDKSRKKSKKKNTVKKDPFKVETQEQIVEVVFGREPSFSDKNEEKDNTIESYKLSKEAEGKELAENNDELNEENPIEIITFEADTMYFDEEDPDSTNDMTSKKDGENNKDVNDSTDANNNKYNETNIFSVYKEQTLSETTNFADEFEQNTNYFDTGLFDEKEGEKVLNYQKEEIVNTSQQQDEIIIDALQEEKPFIQSKDIKSANEKIVNIEKMNKEAGGVFSTLDMHNDVNDFNDVNRNDFETGKKKLKKENIDNDNIVYKSGNNYNNASEVSNSGFMVGFRSITQKFDRFDVNSFKSMTGNLNMNIVREKSTSFVKNNSIYAIVTGAMCLVAVFFSFLVLFNFFTGVIQSLKVQLFMIIIASIMMFCTFIASAFRAGSKRKEEVLVKISLITSFSVITVVITFVTVILLKTL